MTRNLLRRTGIALRRNLTLAEALRKASEARSQFPEAPRARPDTMNW